MNVASTDHANMNVLVIDDEPLIQKLMKSTLGILGVRTIEIVSDGRAALHAIRMKELSGQPFSHIVSNWDIPVMDGIAFLEAFRSMNKKTVVTMVTGHTETTDFNEAKDKGADYFFMKPLDMGMLKTRLAAALDAAFERS